MAIAADLLQSLVPISQFNKGQAVRLTEIEEAYFLLLEANKRNSLY